jgi:hypothetical protein
MTGPRCKWGDGCDQAAGFGTFGSFCEIHAKRLASVNMDAPVQSARARRRAAAAEAASRAPEGASKAPDPLGREPLSVRAARLGRYVQSASEPVRQAEAAEAIGLSSTTGSLPRIVKEARACGWLAPAFGRGLAGGYRPGRVRAPAAEAADPA